MVTGTKLSDGIARHIRKLARDGAGKSEIARMYRLSEEQVSQIIAGKSWRLVEARDV